VRRVARERAHGNRFRQRTLFAPVAIRVVPPRLAAAPGELDALVVWLDRAGADLVLLEPFPVEDLRRMVQEVERAVRDHQRAFEGRPGSERSEGIDAATWSMLQADHAWFKVSLEQFAWFLRIVENEDHGGHRQALGQYGRLLAEALRRHRAMEDEFLRGGPRAGFYRDAARAGQP
jgi:hypothetical protein